MKKYLLGLLACIGLQAQPTNYVHVADQLPPPEDSNDGDVYVVGERFWVAENNGFLFQIGQGSGNNAGFSSRTIESFGSTTAQLSGQVEVAWQSSGTAVRVFLESAEFPDAPSTLTWTITVNAETYTFESSRTQSGSFYLYDTTSDALTSTSGNARVKFWSDTQQNTPFPIRADSAFREFFRSFDSITRLSTDGRYLISYKGANDPAPARLELPSTALISDGSHSIRLISSDGISRTYAFDNSEGNQLYTLRTENALSNALTDLSRHPTENTALESLRGHIPEGDARRNETIDLQPMITAGESKSAVDIDGIELDPATGIWTFTAEDGTTTHTETLPAYIENLYITNTPAYHLALIHRNGTVAGTVDFAPTINTLASNMFISLGGQTVADVNTLTASSVVNIEKGIHPNLNRIIWTTRGGTANNIDLETWYPPDETDTILTNEDGTDIMWQDLVRGLSFVQRNGRDSLVWQRIDLDNEVVFSPRGEAWTLTTTPSSGGNIVTISDNDSPPRTSSVLIPHQVLPIDMLSLTNLTFDSATSGIHLNRRGADGFIELPFPTALTRVGNTVTLTLGGTAAPLSFTLPESTAANGFGRTCDPETLLGPVRLAGNFLQFNRSSGGTATVDLSSIASGSSLTLSGYATLMNTANSTTTVNPSNFYFVVVDAAGNVNRVSVATMEAEFERSEVTNTSLTANADSTASTTTAPSRRQVEIALAGVESGGGGVNHAGAIEIIQDYTGQTGTTNAPGTFALDRLPIGGTASAGNFVGYDANGLVFTNAPAGGGGIALSAIKPFARTADTTSKMSTDILAQPTSTLGGSAIDNTNDRLLLYDSSASGYAQSSINEFAEALKTPLANRLNPDPSGYTSSDDGTFPAWDTDRWVNGMFADDNGFEWTFSTSTDDWTLNYTRGPPAGGTQGQVFAKFSSNNYDYGWTNIVSGGGLSTVASDATLTGTGAQSSPLSVANPFTQIDEEKLDNLRIETRDLFETTFTVGTSTAGQWGESGTQTGFGLGAADAQFSSFGSVASSSVNIDGTTHTLYAVIENGAQDEIILYISGNPNLAGYELEIGEAFLAFNQAYENLNTTDTGESYSIISWHANNLMPASGTTGVDLAINRKINESDYLPDDGANGQILAWASGQPDWIVGTSRLIPVGGGINQVLTKRSATDFDVEWRDAQGRTVPSGQNFPASATIGDQFRLVDDEAVPQDHVLQAAQTDSQRRTIQLTQQSGLPHQVVAYAPALLGPNASLANKVYIVYSGTPSANVASNLVFHADKLTPQTYSISTSAPTGFSHWRQVTGLSYNDVQATHRYYVNVEFGDGTKLFPDRPYTLGFYVYTSTGWEFAPGTAAPWAVQGQPEPRTLLAVTQLIDGPGTGITVAADNAITRTPGAPVLFSPLFDLDDADKQHGLLEVEAILRFTTRSPNTLGFDSTGLQTQRKTGFLFGSAVRASDVYSASAQNGVLVNSWQIYDTNGDVQVGDVYLYFSRNSANQLGYWFYYDPNAGSGARNFALSANFEVAFLHNDAPGRGIPAGGDDTYVLAKASDNDYDVAWVAPTAGPQGPQGEQGPAGPAGPAGSQGIQGMKGDKGDPGDDGTDGATGPAGPAGPAGSQGIQGMKGDKGDPGAAGATGARGPAGPAGPAGSQGIQGEKGDKGDPGAAGATGARGPAGAAGAQGIQGMKGDKGDKGDPGAAGATGPAGPGLPAGGTAGQMIIKASATDYATTWTNLPTIPDVDSRIETYTGQGSSTDTIPGTKLGGQYVQGNATKFLANASGADAIWVDPPTTEDAVLSKSSLPTTGSTGDVVVVDKRHYDWSINSNEFSFTIASTNQLGVVYYGSWSPIRDDTHLHVQWGPSLNFISFSIGLEEIPSPPNTIYATIGSQNITLISQTTTQTIKNYTYFGSYSLPTRGTITMRTWYDSARTQPLNITESWLRFSDLPAGGTANQLIVKSSGTDFDTAWTSTVSSNQIANNAINGGKISNGSITGDDIAHNTVDQDNLASDSVDILELDTVNSGVDNQFLSRNSAGLVWTNAPSGGTGGVTEAQVDARVQAHTGQSSSTDQIAGDRLGTSYVSGQTTKVLANSTGTDGTWVDFPTQMNSDWNETNSASLKFIENKPLIPDNPVYVTTTLPTPAYNLLGNVVISNQSHYVLEPVISFGRNFLLRRGSGSTSTASFPSTVFSGISVSGRQLVLSGSGWGAPPETLYYSAIQSNVGTTRTGTLTRSGRIAGSWYYSTLPNPLIRNSNSAVSLYTDSSRTTRFYTEGSWRQFDIEIKDPVVVVDSLPADDSESSVVILNNEHYFYGETSNRNVFTFTVGSRSSDRGYVKDSRPGVFEYGTSEESSEIPDPFFVNWNYLSSFSTIRIGSLTSYWTDISAPTTIYLTLSVNGGSPINFTASRTGSTFSSSTRNNRNLAANGSIVVLSAYTDSLRTNPFNFKVEKSWQPFPSAGGLTQAQVDARVEAYTGQVGTEGLINVTKLPNVTTAKIADDAVTSAKIAANTITAADINTGAVENTELADDAVTSAKIAANTIVADDIAANAVGASELAEDSVGLGEINTSNTGTANQYLQRSASGLVWNTPAGGGAGSGVNHAGVIEIVKDFTGQTGTTNQPGTFNIDRIPTLTTNELPIWDGNYPAGQYRTGTSTLERDYDVVATVGDLRNSVRGAGQAITHPASSENNGQLVSARNVAQAIENVIPLGGTTGQIPMKSTDDNYQIVWTNAPSGSITAASEITATIGATTLWTTNANSWFTGTNLPPVGVQLSDIEGSTTETDITLSETADEFTFGSAGLYTFGYTLEVIMASESGGTEPTSANMTGGSRVYPEVWLEKQVSGQTAWAEMMDTRRRGYSKALNAQGPGRARVGGSHTFVASADDKYRMRAGGYGTDFRYLTINSVTNGIRIVRHPH